MSSENHTRPYFPIQLPGLGLIARKMGLVLLITLQWLAGMIEFATASAQDSSAFSPDKVAITANEKTKGTTVSTFGLYDLSTFDITEQAGVAHLLIGGKETADSNRLTLRYLRYNHHDKQWHPVSTLDKGYVTINC
ncbi:MAG: hypothetical protein RQ714_06675 [Nitrosomonas sp.]|nr:hypothetical protein [Nitrosomonas sp.]